MFYEGYRAGKAYYFMNGEKPTNPYKDEYEAKEFQAGLDKALKEFLSATVQRFS